MSSVRDRYSQSLHTYTLALAAVFYWILPHSGAIHYGACLPLKQSTRRASIYMPYLVCVSREVFAIFFEHHCFWVARERFIRLAKNNCVYSWHKRNLNDSKTVLILLHTRINFVEHNLQYIKLVVEQERIVYSVS
jgi:hypothetical protein